MDSETITAGFIGAGGIARSHAYSLGVLKYFYDDAPPVRLAAVCSATAGSREAFAARFGFERGCSLDEFVGNTNINSVYILGPNSVHSEHFRAAMSMPSVKRIYLEKPVCSGSEEEKAISSLAAGRPDVKVQVGFQYLFSPAVREALTFWKSGILGKPVHFDFKYYHGDYLNKGYRDKRANRLTPAPDGGAMADLGSHAISMLIAFVGERLRITGAVQAGSFPDVPAGSDLFSLITLSDEITGAAGSLAASRISSGTGDSLSFELYAEKGALRYSSDTAAFFEYFTEESGHWTKQPAGSSYRPLTSFPSGHVPAGWLRSMVHAHYVFLRDFGGEAVIPDLAHGLAVQRLVTGTAEQLAVFCKARG
jgi:predicted dehydrogenase